VYIRSPSSYSRRGSCVEISVFTLFLFFVSVRSLPLSPCRLTPRDHCPCCPRRRRLAVAFFLCILSQPLLLLWPLPLLWTVHPLLRPKHCYTSTTPHLMALLVGAHDLFMKWHAVEIFQLSYFSCICVSFCMLRAFFKTMIHQYHREEDASPCRYKYNCNQTPWY
jgi:hypothetical protein